MLTVQKKHRDDFNQFLHNQTGVQAFNVVRDVLSHCTAVSNEAKAEECHKKMEDIMLLNTEAEASVSPLEGV